MKGKIKIGTRIGQDHSIFIWPNCAPPVKDYIGKEYKFKAINQDMIFDIEDRGKGMFKCVAPGFGEKGNYGNGAILVFDSNGIKKI